MATVLTKSWVSVSKLDRLWNYGYGEVMARSWRDDDDFDVRLLRATSADVGQSQQPPGILVTCKLRRGWVAAGVYVPHLGALHLADLRIRPGRMPPIDSGQAADARATLDPSLATRSGWIHSHVLAPLDRGRLLADLNDTREPHAIHALMLREVPLAEMGERANRYAPELVAFEAMLADHSRSSELAAAAEDDLTPARRRYLLAAALYARMPADSVRPRSQLADQLNVQPQEVSDYLRWARKHGYLTSPGGGRRGGKLTPLGAALAARHLDLS